MSASREAPSQFNVGSNDPEAFSSTIIGTRQIIFMYLGNEYEVSLVQVTFLSCLCAQLRPALNIFPHPLHFVLVHYVCYNFRTEYFVIANRNKQ